MQPSHRSFWNLVLLCVCRRAGQAQVADQLSLLTLHRQETLGRPVHELLDTLFARATVLRVLGHAEQAEYLLIRAVKLGEQRLGWGHPHCAVALKLLGEWCVEAKRYEDAAVWLVQVSALRGPLIQSPACARRQ